MDRILDGIPDLKALDKVQLEQLLATEAGQVQLDFKVSPEEFEKWKADKRRLEATNTIIHAKNSSLRLMAALSTRQLFI